MISGSRIWYKSPFRNEKTPSFMVESSHMYDFGGSTNYTILDFCQELWHKDIYTTAQVLANDFNINIDAERKLSKEDIDKVKREQEELIIKREKQDKWFKDTFASLTNLNRKVHKIIANSDIDTLSISICTLQNKLERILDENTNSIGGSFIVSTKEELYERYKDLDFNKENEILNNIDTIFDDLIKRDLKVEQEEEEENER